MHTVKNYLFSVFDKIGVSNRAELILCLLASSAPPKKPVTRGMGGGRHGSRATSAPEGFPSSLSAHPRSCIKSPAAKERSRRSGPKVCWPLPLNA